MADQSAVQYQHTGLQAQPYLPPDASPPGPTNVHGAERFLSASGGMVLLTRGLRQGGVAGWLQALVGGVLVARGVTAKCPVKRALAATSFEKTLAEENGWHSATAIITRIVIRRPRHQVYAYWRNFNNLSHFMKHIERIEMLSDSRSRWVVKAPVGQTVEWTAHVTEDVPDRRIAWETEYDADIRSSGWVEFEDTPDGRGTQVAVMIAYEPPGGKIGHLAARLWHEDPATQVCEDLQSLKEILEAGADRPLS
nr:DUF2892 domain-containing protein [Pseudomonas sp.]